MSSLQEKMDAPISKADVQHLSCVETQPFAPMGWLYSGIFEDMYHRGLVYRVGNGGYAITTFGRGALIVARALAKTLGVRNVNSR